MRDGAQVTGRVAPRTMSSVDAKLPSRTCPLSSHVVGEGDVIVCEAVALAVEIAEKSQSAVHAQKEVVNAGTSSALFSSSPGFTLLWFDSCLRAGV